MIRTLVVLLALAACGGGSDATEVKRDPERPKRVIEPPSGRVRALPPHAIRNDGVGPYRLGETLVELLAELPSGPRIALFELPGVHRSVLRTEDDQILIGGEPLGKATFVAVTGAEVARTETGGVHVGSTREELVRALGPSFVQPDRARDYHLVVPSGLHNARVVFDEHDHIVALVIVGDVEPAPGAGSAEPTCARPAGEGGRVGACLASGEQIAVDGDDLSVFGTDPDKPIATARVANLAFVTALRAPGEDRDELVAIARSDEPRARSWSLTAFRLDAGKLVKTIDAAPVYTLTAANARVIGAELHDLDLYLELTARPGAIEVGGVLITRNGDRIRDAVAINQLTVVPRSR